LEMAQAIRDHLSAVKGKDIPVVITSGTAVLSSTQLQGVRRLQIIPKPWL